MKRKNFAGEKEKNPRRSYDDEYVEELLHNFRGVQKNLADMPDVWSVSGTTPGTLRSSAREGSGWFDMLGKPSDKWDGDQIEAVLKHKKLVAEGVIKEVDRILGKRYRNLERL